MLIWGNGMQRSDKGGKCISMFKGSVWAANLQAVSSRTGIEMESWVSILVRLAGAHFVIHGVVWAVLGDLTFWWVQSCTPGWPPSPNSIATSADGGIPKAAEGMGDVSACWGCIFSLQGWADWCQSNALPCSHERRGALKE